MSDARIRLFVALEIPAEVRAALGSLAAGLKPSSRPNVRWTNPQSIHLTLKFIGEVPEAQMAGIHEALAAVHAGEPVEAAFRGIGWFPNARRPRVLWAGVEADARLAALAEAADGALERVGIARESREFRPHLTLARIQSDAGLDGLRREVERLGTPEFGAARYTEFDLMQSRLDPKGAVYTRVARFPFAAGIPATRAGAC